MLRGRRFIRITKLDIVGLPDRSDILAAFTVCDMKYIFNAIAFTYIKLKLYYFAREEYQDVSSVLLVNGTNKLEEIFLKLNGITFI